MSEIQLLWLVLFVLYLGDGIWLVSWNTCVIERWWPCFNWRLRRSNEWPSSQTLALIPLWPLPLGTSFQLDPLAVSLSPEGLANCTVDAWTLKGRPRQSGFCKQWSEVEGVTAQGVSVLVDDQNIVTLPLHQHAMALAETMESIRRAEPGDREGLILEWWRASTDIDGIAERLEEAVKEERLLRWGGAALSCVMFVIVPMVLLRISGPVVLFSLASSLFALVLFNAWIFMRAHTRAFPEERWARIESTLIMCLNWPMAARAADVLSRHRLCGLHPVAVALAQNPLRGGRDFAEHVIRDTRYPLSFAGVDIRAQKIIDWHQQMQQLQLNKIAAQVGFSLDESPPEHGSRCPRCRASFLSRLNECPDCPGVNLVHSGGE